MNKKYPFVLRQSVIDFMAAWIDAQLAYGDLPGLAVAVLHGEETIWSQGFGFADVENKISVTTKTLFRVASITKLFTGTALLQLRDAGKVRLDDPVKKYLPWFLPVNRFEEGPEITVSQLLTHTAGLTRETGHTYWTSNDFPTIEEVKENIKHIEIVKEPETAHKYSNFGFVLAGQIISEVSGLEYTEYIQQYLLEPLEMSQTYIVSLEPHDPRLALGYTRRLPKQRKQVTPFTDCRAISSAANLATNVEDLSKFARFALGFSPQTYSSILKPSTLKEMQRVHWLDSEWNSGWGLAYRVNRMNGKTYVGHNGALFGYRSLFQLCTADKLAVVVLSNSDEGDVTLFAEQFFQGFSTAAQAPENETALARSKSIPLEQHKLYCGKFRVCWADCQVLVLDGSLHLIYPQLKYPHLDYVKLIPIKEHVFRAETLNSNSADAELISFENIVNGVAHRIRFGDNFYERIEEW